MSPYSVWPLIQIVIDQGAVGLSLTASQSIFHPSNPNLREPRGLVTIASSFSIA